MVYKDNIVIVKFCIQVNNNFILQNFVTVDFWLQVFILSIRWYKGARSSWPSGQDHMPAQQLGSCAFEARTNLKFTLFMAAC